MTPDLDLDGAAAPPRTNGDLAFAHPWQSRLFASTMALCDAGLIEYAALRERLILQIATSENANPRHPGDYWSSWQDALEGLLAAQGLCDPAELEHRAIAFAGHP